MEIKYKDSAGVSEDEIELVAKGLETYRKQLVKIRETKGYEAPESSLNLPYDRKILEEVWKVKADLYTDTLKYIVVIGIGGSNLGTKAIYDALFGHFDFVKPERFPKILFLDTNNPVFLRESLDMLRNSARKSEEIVISIVSKSGETTETIANAEFVIAALSPFIPNISERIVVTTEEGSQLWKVARKKGIKCLGLSKNVGGRYSVFSAVGLMPLSFLEVDLEQLLEGAQQACADNLKKGVENPAIISSTILAHNWRIGKNINDNFIFNPELESLGKWYRQLMGESIGKEEDVDGNIVNRGITPRVSIGSTDMHSVGQLYLGGPHDKLTTFIWSKHNGEGPNVPAVRFFPELVKSIEGKSAGNIMMAILTGVKTSYKKEELPFMEVVLSEISAHSLGEFLQFKMIEMMYLGKLLNINTFDQPSVESYKEETRKLLEK